MTSNNVVTNDQRNLSSRTPSRTSFRTASRASSDGLSAAASIANPRVPEQARQRSGWPITAFSGTTMLLCALSDLRHRYLDCDDPGRALEHDHREVRMGGSSRVQNWDPVNWRLRRVAVHLWNACHFAARPGDLAVPLALGVAIFLTELCPQKALRATHLVFDRAARGDPERGVRIVGGLRAGAYRSCRIRLGRWLVKYLGWTGFFGGLELRCRSAYREPHSFDHDPADNFVSITRDMMMAVPNHQREAVLALGCDSLGDDSHRACCAMRASGLWARSSWGWDGRWARRWRSR